MRVGMDLPEEKSIRARWADAAPKMSMAMAEAGFPNRLEAVANPRFPATRVYENSITFDGPKPPDHVLRKAAELCGVVDLMESLLDGGCCCAYCIDQDFG